MDLNSICVYCGSSPGLLPEYTKAAFGFGQLVARRKLTLVYGGGNVGLMGALADGAVAENGKVIGVMPRRLIDKEIAHQGIAELHSVQTMHERKTKMADLSDAFVALPGGFGTLEEIFEVYTWTQLNLQAKPCAFLNVAGFYTPLIKFLDHVVVQQFVKPEHYQALIVEDDAEEILERIKSYQHKIIDKLTDRV